jgi:hypothetical protein
MLDIFRRLGSSRRQLRSRARPPVRRLTLEYLEDRTLPALTWSSGIALPGARSGDVAVLEPDNSILVLGGGRTTVNQLAAGGTAWGTANPIDVARTSAGVGSIGGSELLVYGGSSNETPQSSALQYDPTNSGNISPVAPMSTPRTLFAFATDGSNRAYAIGGFNDNEMRLASVERFDPATGQWSAVASLPQALSGATAVYDGNGHILVFGGATSSAHATSTALRYNVLTNTWTTLPALPTATTEAAAVLGADGNVFVVGGLDSAGAAQATVQAYHPITNTWTSETSLPVALSDEAVVTDSQGRIEVLGGKNAQHSSVSSVYVTQSLGNGNVAPVISPPANTNAVLGSTFTDTISAFGLPGPTFSLPNAPPSMTIDSTTGVITWAPVTGPLGAQTVTVQASNAAGTDTKTFTVTVVPDTTPPTTPTGLTLGTVTTTTVSFSWLPSTDNVAVAGYRIFTYVPAYGGGRGGHYHPAVYTLVGTSTTATGTATGLSAGASYNFVVAAYDTSNNQSGYSNIATTTLLLAPSISYSDNGVYGDPPVTVIANHSMLLGITSPGNPYPTDSIVSAPSGVSFAFYGTLFLTWTPNANQVGPNHIILEADNSVGSFTLDILVTVIADVPIPSLSVDGGYTYTLGNMTADPNNPFTYSLNLIPAFSGTGPNPQYALSGTPFSFQLTGTSNTSPTTYTLVSGPSTMTVDPNTGIGTWSPGASDAGPTSVTVSATNSAGSSYLTFNFPTYFTTAPTNVAISFNSSVPNTPGTALNPVVTWTPPANSAGVADYKVMVIDANTQAVTTFDTQSTATSFTLTGISASQKWVTVTAYDANGNPSITSALAPLYLAALPTIGWTFNSPNAVAGSPLSVQFSPFYSGLTYTIASGPGAASMTNNVLSWTPGLSDVGPANIVVAAATGWGTEYLTLSFPVYFTNAPSGVSVQSSTDSTGVTTWTATWTAPTLNTASITGYQITFVDASAPPGTPPTILTVAANNLSVVLAQIATLHGAVQVAAVDAAGDLGVVSPWVTF